MDLEKRIFECYIEHKSETLVDAIEQGMQVGLFDWEQCRSAPTCIRSYIHDITLTLVAIHCEVSMQPSRPFFYFRRVGVYTVHLPVVTRLDLVPFVLTWQSA